MSENPTMICMPLASAAMVAKNSTTDKKCTVCHQRVVIAPSGQRFLKANPTAAIVCAHCFEPNSDDEHKLAAPNEEILAEMRTAEPNTWRNRN